MSALDVIRRVEACGGRLTVENGELKLRAPAALPEDVMQAVSGEKPAIMITLGAPLDVTVANILDDIRPHLSPTPLASTTPPPRFQAAGARELAHHCGLERGATRGRSVTYAPGRSAGGGKPFDTTQGALQAVATPPPLVPATEETGLRRQRSESKAEGDLVSQPTCAHCGASFAPYRSWQRFCSPRCRWQAWDRGHPRVWRAHRGDLLGKPLEPFP